MVQYLLDTNHASPLVTLHHQLRPRFFAAIQAGQTFAVCVPTLTEVLFGISTLPRAAQNHVEWNKLRAWLPCYALDEDDAEKAAELRLLLRQKGWQLGAMDALIATVALRYNLTLLTSDKDFQSVPNLQLENWL